jgi:DNA-binding response OmpR family regulator
MRALIAEDDPVSRRMLKAFLSKADYEVVVATDGLEAWALLQQPDAPRLVILDWMMPRMDGIQLCRKIRNWAESFYIYIVMLTARTQSQDIADGLKAGVDDYLTKPFNPQELMVRLRAGRRILDLQERLVAASERLQVLVADNPEADLQNSTSLVDLFGVQTKKQGKLTSAR